MLFWENSNVSLYSLEISCVFQGGGSNGGSNMDENIKWNGVTNHNNEVSF